MRDRYYRISDRVDLPDNAVLVHIWREDGLVLARIEGDDLPMTAAPDLVLFHAALQRLRQDLMAVFVLIDDTSIWMADWGDLVDYRVTRRNGKPALRFVQPPAFII